MRRSCSIRLFYLYLPNLSGKRLGSYLIRDWLETRRKGQDVGFLKTTTQTVETLTILFVILGMPYLRTSVLFNKNKAGLKLIQRWVCASFLGTRSSKGFKMHVLRSESWGLGSVPAMFCIIIPGLRDDWRTGQSKGRWCGLISQSLLIKSL